MLSALQTALSAATDGAARRSLLLALGDRHLAIQQPAEALDCFAQVLAPGPRKRRGPGKAAQAAEASGASEQAVGYRRLLTALGAASAPVAAPPGPPTLSVAPSPADATPLSSVSPQAERQPVPLATDGASPVDGPSNVLRLVDGGPDAERTSFADVGGLEAVKKRIDLAFLAPLRQPELFAAYGKSIKGGLLLYGPPGCGKTHLARATAGEVGARFTSIGLVDVLDMWIGESEKRLHELFENARREARRCCSSTSSTRWARKRSQLRHSAGRQPGEPASGRAGRPGQQRRGLRARGDQPPVGRRQRAQAAGRFDRTVFVPPPDAQARSTILNLHLQHRPVQGIDVAALAARTKGMSGADLVHLCDSAVEQALDEALRTGARRPVGMQDFERSLAEVKPSIGPWVEVARNYALYANEGGGLRRAQRLAEGPSVSRGGDRRPAREHVLPRTGEARRGTGRPRPQRTGTHRGARRPRPGPAQGQGVVRGGAGAVGAGPPGRGPGALRARPRRRSPAAPGGIGCSATPTPSGATSSWPWTPSTRPCAWTPRTRPAAPSCPLPVGAGPAPGRPTMPFGMPWATPPTTPRDTASSAMWRWDGASWTRR